LSKLLLLGLLAGVDVHPIHLRESSSMAHWGCEHCGDAITPAELAMGNRGPDPTHWIVWHWVWADLDNQVAIRAPFHFICWIQFQLPIQIWRRGGA